MKWVFFDFLEMVKFAIVLSFLLLLGTIVFILVLVSLVGFLPYVGLTIMIEELRKLFGEKE